MKKLLLLSAFLIFACSSDDNSNSDACPGQDALLEQYEDAAVAFADNPSSTTCPAFISSLELFIQCGEGFSTSELNQFQQIVDTVDCSIY
tara:strand:- start:142 stop:411 length:270 start_codon:yes stop_codon:yes gene_type:complete